MSSIDSIAAAFEGVRQSYEAGRVAHAYLLIGAPRGNAAAFAESFLQLLFCSAKDKPCGSCTACQLVKEHKHPDTLWIMPESKGRLIRIEEIRENLGPRISQTSYAGGWKAGVLVHADRLTEGAANAFLKTLEEPPGQSILLLLTDAPQELLPTIVSRCQRIVLSGGQARFSGDWVEPLLEVLRLGRPAGSLEVVMQSGLLKGILDSVKEAAAAEMGEVEGDGEGDAREVRDARVSARVLEVRSDVMRCLLLWKRDVLFAVLGLDDQSLHFAEEAGPIREQARGLTFRDAMEDVRAVESMIRRLDRNLPAEAVFEVGLTVRRPSP